MRRRALYLIGIGWLLAAGAALAQDAPAKLAAPTGIYALTNTHNWVQVEGKRVDLFPLSQSGVTNYANWSEIERERGQCRWGGFRRLMEEARQADKKLAYGILAGDHMPGWLAEVPGVATWRRTNGQGKARVTYLPWVERDGRRVLNEAALTVWGETVAAFAREVRSHPDYRERIAYIPITGGPTANGLEIMWAAERAEDFATLKWGAAEDALLAEFWKRCVTLFLEQFPDVPLGLAITDYVGVLPNGTHRRSLSVARDVTEFALAEAARRNALVLPMGLWVGKPGLTNRTHPLVSLLLGYAARAPIGLQGELRTESPEAMTRLLEFTRDSGASWLELWHSDMIHPQMQPLLRDWYRQHPVVKR